MYRIASTTTQTRTPQLLMLLGITNPHMSKYSGVIHTTSLADHSIQLRIKNVVCAECGTMCVFNSNHDACVSRYLKDLNARTKKPNVVPISASKHKRKANKSIATPHKKTVASDTTIQKSQKKRVTIRSLMRIQIRMEMIVQLILFIVDSGCTKHMTGNLKLLCNFVEKFLADQASVFMEMTFEQNSSSLGRQCLMTFDRSRSSIGLHGNDAPFLNVQKTFEQRSSSLVLHQMTSDHNRSELGIQDHSNEQSSSKLVPKVVP
ncbi:hypothetical protein Tco_0412400 [Tanacetum coccineum]